MEPSRRYKANAFTLRQISGTFDRTTQLIVDLLCSPSAAVCVVQVQWDCPHAQAMAMKLEYHGP